MGILDTNKDITPMTKPVMYIGECVAFDIRDDYGKKIECEGEEYRYVFFFNSPEHRRAVYHFINKQSDNTRFLLDDDFDVYEKSKSWYGKQQLIQYFESDYFNDGLSHSHFVQVVEWKDVYA